MIAPGSATRLLLLIIATLLLLLFLGDNITPEGTRYASNFGSRPHSKPLRVSVLETKGCHDEVSASFFSGLGQLPECEVEAFLEARRFGIEAIYDQLPGVERRSVHNRTDFVPNFYEQRNPDVVFLITGEYSIVDGTIAPTLKWLLQNTDAILFAIVHHPDEWKTEAHLKITKPWVESRRIRFITLSKHVSKYMVETVVDRWARNVETSMLPHVNTFPPVFTVPPLSLEHTSETKRVRFAMQGDLIVDRMPNRDYRGTFRQFAKLIEGEAKSLELRVLGNGRIPKVPDEAKNNIQFDVSLPYPEFYQTLQSATALLPAFADSSYTRNKASSTVSASFVAGAPLIAGNDLLSAYTFVSKEDVYYREDGENEIDVIARVALIPEEERLEKSRKLREKNANMTKQTADLLRLWIAESFMERDL